MSNQRSITADLKTTFDLASLRHEANHLRKATDWEKSRSIREEFEQERNTQEKHYYASYDARVASVTKTLIDRKAEVNKDFKKRWFGEDAFSASMITTQAHRLVQQDHQRRVMKINEREAAALEELVSQVKQRDTALEKPKHEFNKARDVEAYQVIHHGAESVNPPFQRHR